MSTGSFLSMSIRCSVREWGNSIPRYNSSPRTQGRLSKVQFPVQICRFLLYLNLFHVPRYYYSLREKDRCVMVLSNFGYDGWRMSQSRVNLDLNHILVAGMSFRCSEKIYKTFYGFEQKAHQKSNVSRRRKQNCFWIQIISTWILEKFKLNFSIRTCCFAIRLRRLKSSFFREKTIFNQFSKKLFWSSFSAFAVTPASTFLNKRELKMQQKETDSKNETFSIPNINFICIAD